LLVGNGVIFFILYRKKLRLNPADRFFCSIVMQIRDHMGSFEEGARRSSITCSEPLSVQVATCATVSFYPGDDDDEGSTLMTAVLRASPWFQNAPWRDFVIINIAAGSDAPACMVLARLWGFFSTGRSQQPGEVDEKSSWICVSTYSNDEYRCDCSISKAVLPRWQVMAKDPGCPKVYPLAMLEDTAFVLPFLEEGHEKDFYLDKCFYIPKETYFDF